MAAMTTAVQTQSRRSRLEEKKDMGESTSSPVEKIPPAFERRCIQAGRFASPSHDVKSTLQCAVERRAFLVGADMRTRINR